MPGSMPNIKEMACAEWRVEIMHPSEDKSGRGRESRLHCSSEIIARASWCVEVFQIACMSGSPLSDLGCLGVCGRIPCAEL